jgi:hypothetical protein
VFVQEETLFELNFCYVFECCTCEVASVLLCHSVAPPPRAPAAAPPLGAKTARHLMVSFGLVEMGSGVSRSKSVLVPPLPAAHQLPLPPQQRTPVPSSPQYHSPSLTAAASLAAHVPVAAAAAPLLDTLSPLGLTLSGLRAFAKTCDAAAACDGLSCREVMQQIVPLVQPPQAAEGR